MSISFRFHFFSDFDLAFEFESVQNRRRVDVDVVGDASPEFGFDYVFGFALASGFASDFEIQAPFKMSCLFFGFGVRFRFRLRLSIVM